MILIDFSQLTHAAVHVAYAQVHAGVDDKGFLRHLVLSQILTALKYRREYGNPVVVACDDHSWRHGVFPEYKWARRNNRKESGIDWDAVNLKIDGIQDEIAESFPYIVIKVAGAEGDDVIATLARRYGGSGSPTNSLFEDEDSSAANRVLVVSSDKDFGQLHDVIDQYDPKKRMIKPREDAAHALRMQILHGDSTDGIPNILSPSNSFSDKIKQKSVTSKLESSWLNMSKEAICTTDELRANWDRNQMLVDLSRTPANIQEAIVESFIAQQDKDCHGKILEFFAAHHLRELTSRMQEFL